MRSYPVAAMTVLATLGLLGCNPSPTAPRLDQLTLDVVSGDGQTAIVGTQLTPLIVKVTSGGNPVAGQVLNFRVTSGGGSVYGGTELTDAHGIAQELWTLGTKASEPQKVEVRAVESNTGAEKVFGTFTATALPGPASLLKVAAGDQQTAGVGQPVATTPAVLVTDQYGNPVAGIAVNFVVASGGGTVTGASAITGANGMAAVGSWTLGPSASANTLTAMTPGLTGSPVTFTAMATGPAGLNITNYRGDGQTQPAGSTLPIAPAAQVTDQNGHPVAGVTITFSVTAGGGSITGPTQVTDLNGIATVGSWTLGTALGVNELKANFSTGVSRGSTIFVATAIASQRLYVANNANNSITIYAPGATGNATPTATIMGSNTGLASPTGIALDDAGNIYVANNNSNSITVFAPGANGDATPMATITGGATELALPSGIALDAAGNIYVANCGGNLPPITVYPPGANGDVTPIATIMGSNTGLRCPTGIAFDAAGNIYVANNTGNPGTITVYASGAHGDATPTVTIAGGNTGLLRPVGIVLDAARGIYVTNSFNPGTITVYAPGANGNAAPTATIAGGNTGVLGPGGIGFDAAGNLSVANCIGNSITIYEPGAHGNATPIATITGSNTGLSCPAGIAF